jgi:hypothetical protein
MSHSLLFNGGKSLALNTHILMTANTVMSVYDEYFP